MRLSPTLVVGALLSATVLIAAALSLVWTPYDVESMNISARLRPPGAEFWLGTDHFGRDIFSQILVGARTSVLVALAAVSIAVMVGVPLGLLAAARPDGWLDELVMRFNDLVFAFPAILLAIILAASFGPGAWTAIVAIGVFNVPVFARLARGGALSLWTREFIMAARAAGKGSARISVEHILPNILNLLIVQATIQFSLGIISEAALSYVGLGTQPPTPSLGRMLAEAQTMIYVAPWYAIFPGLAIVATVMGLNLLGDGLRDLTDPRLRRAR